MRQLLFGLACTLCVGILTPAQAARRASLAWRTTTCCKGPQPAHDTLYPVPPTSRLRIVVADVAYELEARIWRPVGPGPFPLAVLQHGTPADKAKLPTTKPGFTRAARWFVRQGFVVVIALRPGFGRSEGRYLEDAGPCADADYVVAGRKTALLEAAIIRACQTLPAVDPTHVVVIGQSAGGLGAIALGATPPPGVCGIISFAGGRGGNGKEHICGGGAAASSGSAAIWPG